MIYQFYVGLIFRIGKLKNTKRKSSASNKSRELTLSASELSRFGIGVMNRALKVVNTAKKGKITIKLEKE